MTAGTLDDILGMVPESEPEFPFVAYDADGDCVEFLSTGEGFYAERVDSLVTVYRSRESDEIIGSLVKGVRAHLDKIIGKCPGFRVEVQDGKIKLSHLFSQRMWGEGDILAEKALTLTYQKLRDVAEDCDAEADLDGAIGGRHAVPC